MSGLAGLRSAAASVRRARLADYYGTVRSDLPAEVREGILAKVAGTSDAAILADRSCVGKHWFVMDFESRSVCPYCGWEMAPL